MIRNFYVCKIDHSQNGRSWGWIVYIFSMCNVRKAQKIKNSYHIISSLRRLFTEATISIDNKTPKNLSFTNFDPQSEETPYLPKINTTKQFSDEFELKFPELSRAGKVASRVKPSLGISIFELK